MKTASSDLLALLNSATDRFFMADCFTITLLNGGVYRYTSLDMPVVLNGNTFLSSGPQISGIKYSVKAGLSVDEQTITIAAKTTDLIQGQPFLQALASGLLDDAGFQYDRAFLPGWGQPATGYMDPLFYGSISTIDKLGRTSAQVKVKSLLRLLDRDYPRNTYAAQCSWTLYGFGCGLAKSAFSGSATVAGSSTTSAIYLTGASFTDGTNYSQGTITFTSGALNGVSATIKGWSNSPLTLILAMPLPTAPSIGTTCTMAWGCDHTLGSQGCAKFSNTAKFRGFPYVPPPSTGL